MDEIERLKAIIRSQDAALAHWRRESDRDSGTIARLSREVDAGTSARLSRERQLGVILKLHGYSAPVKHMEPHPFLVVEDNQFCGDCGGGILHPIHEAQPPYAGV
jgi:hypothetical protein